MGQTSLRPRKMSVTDSHQLGKIPQRQFFLKASFPQDKNNLQQSVNVRIPRWNTIGG